MFVLYVEILEAFSSSPVPAESTEFTAAQISLVSDTVSQPHGTSTAVHHTSSVSSVKHVTANVNSISQLPQGLLCV